MHSQLPLSIANRKSFPKTHRRTGCALACQAGQHQPEWQPQESPRPADACRANLEAAPGNARGPPRMLAMNQTTLVQTFSGSKAAQKHVAASVGPKTGPLRKNANRWVLFSDSENGLQKRTPVKTGPQRAEYRVQEASFTAVLQLNSEWCSGSTEAQYLVFGPIGRASARPRKHQPSLQTQVRSLLPRPGVRPLVFLHDHRSSMGQRPRTTSTTSTTSFTRTSTRGSLLEAGGCAPRAAVRTCEKNVPETGDRAHSGLGADF